MLTKKIPADIVWEDENSMAFWDIAPAAPVHVLVIPKKHIQSLYHVQPSDAPLLGTMMTSFSTLADKLGIAEKGFRVQTNIGKDGRQAVPHLHFHLLGGKKLL